MRLTILTDIPSPYQVELFDEVAGRVERFRAIYVRRSDPSRAWEERCLGHDHAFLETLSAEEIEETTQEDGLVVFCEYRHPVVRRMMERRAALGLPWCFWGERLGFRHAGLLGRLYRRWMMRTLHAHRVPIWGIGGWAVESYRREFGRRQYFNVPYFSDLSRFEAALENGRHSRRRVFLYSGSLSERKGVDLLAEAFRRTAGEFPEWDLHFLGDGPLRDRLEEALAQVRDRVMFLGFQDWDALPRCYGAADVLCAPSRHDGWALVVPEGLAAGVPVISTDRTGAAIDLIETGKNGWIVKAGDAEALEQALRAAAALSNSGLEAMRQAALATAAKHSLVRGAARLIAAAEETVRGFGKFSTCAE